MTLDASEVVMGSSGSVALAPTGTALPTTAIAALDVAFVDAGYLGEEGATLTDTKEIAEHGAWQALGAIRRNVRRRSTQVAFNILQWNERTLPFAFGGGAVTEPTPGNYLYTPPAPEDLDTRSLVLTWLDQGYTYRLIVPSGIVTQDVETVLNRDALAGLPITFGAQSNGVDPAWSIRTNDPAFEAA